MFSITENNYFIPVEVNKESNDENVVIEDKEFELKTVLTGKYCGILDNTVENIDNYPDLQHIKNTPLDNLKINKLLNNEIETDSNC